MAKVGKQKIDELIKEMSHYDPDNMEMGAKRLTQMILSGQVILDKDQVVANIVREAFMKQIESQNDTVQSEAIKYLAEIVPKLPSSQVQIIFEKILEYITSVELVEKKRERYGACAATVIHQAAEEHGHKLENLFLKSITKLLEFKDKKTEIQIILINNITEFVKKWPIVASRLKYDRKNLTLYLLKNVEVKTKLQIIKKSQNCIGKLAVIADKDILDIILNDQDWGLVNYIFKNKSKKSVDNLKQLRNGLLCLSQVIRTLNIELRHWIRGISLQLIEVINEFKGVDQIDYIEIICDIIDASLTILSYTLKTFSKQVKTDLQNSQNSFNSFITDLLNFNVQGMMSYAGEPMQVEQEYYDEENYYEQAEVDQKCWKVRRSVLFYIPFLAKQDKNFLTRLGNGQFIEDLGNKLIEEHSMVSEMAFQAFNQLIQLISIDRALTNDVINCEEMSMSLQRVKSNALQVADMLIKEIKNKIKIIFNNAKFNDQLKIESSRILLRIIQIYNHILITSEEETFNMINFILEELKKTSINQNKSNLLLCLRELISNDHPFGRYQSIYNLFFELIAKNSNFKTQNILMTNIKKTLDLFAADISANPKYLNMALALLKEKIKQFDGDKLIKLAVAKCISTIFQNYSITDDDKVYFLEMLSAKLKIEVDKLYIIQILVKLHKNGKPSAAQVKILQVLAKQVGQNLGSNNYELNAKSISAIHQILQILGDSCSQKMLTELIQKSRLLLNDSKIPSFFKIILQVNPKILKPYSQLIIKSTESFYISKLISESVIDTASCVKILKGLDLIDRAKRISLTLSQIKIKQEQIIPEIDQSMWGKILIGTLGYIGTDKIIGLLFKYINQFKTDQGRFEAASAIGNIVSRNPDSLIPQLIDSANKSKDVYIYNYIFKQMLNYSTASFSCVFQLIEWLLLKAQQKFQTESNYYITSECVGKLAFINRQTAKLVIANGKSDNENRRLIVANSLRYGLDGKSESDVQNLDDYIHTVAELMNDAKVRVRQGAAKSLVFVAQSFVRHLKQYTHNQVFWKTLINNCTINDSLIVVIDYGICKQIRDEGKNLRLESFNLLQILVKKIHLDAPLIEQLMKVSLMRINDQSSNDIILKRLNIIKNLCEIDYSYFIRLQDEFVKRIGVKQGILKKYNNKGVEDERAEIYVKGVIKEILDINNLALQENVDNIASFVVELRNNANINAIIDGVEKSGK